MSMEYVSLYYTLIAVNVVAFLLFGVDKAFAKMGVSRVPESLLLMLAFIGGAPAAFVAMRLFKHKTRKRKFSVTVPLLLLLYSVLAVVLWVWKA